MKNTGIVRRVDNLGRVVIPKEIRGKFHLKEGNPLEVHVDEDSIVLKKYESIYGLKNIAERYHAIFQNYTSKIVAIAGKKTILLPEVPEIQTDRILSDSCLDFVQGDSIYRKQFGSESVKLYEDSPFEVLACQPIQRNGNTIGSVLLLQSEQEVVDPFEIHLIQLFAKILLTYEIEVE